MVTQVNDADVLTPSPSRGEGRGEGESRPTLWLAALIGFPTC